MRTAVSERATAVVIDVLRASSTLTVARAHGATRVIPIASPEEARTRARAEPDALLCGERDGMKIAGFDLGNSPAEYTQAAVGGKSLIFASTNGSLAMIAAARARRRVLGAFVNASAVVATVAAEEEVVMVCAGKLGQPSLEDLACAGWLCEALAQRGALIEDGTARLARALAPAGPDEVRAMLQGSSHGRYLRALEGEFARDVERCAELDCIDRAFDW